MLAMRYTVRLTAERDASWIKSRVATRKPSFDGLLGLYHRSCLYDPADRIYAAFFIWTDVQAMRRYLAADLFQEVVTTFGRPRVRCWSLLHFGHGADCRKPTFALWEQDKVETSESLPSLLDREATAHRQLIRRQSLFAHAVILDPDRWEISRVSLWEGAGRAPPSQADCIQDFKVLAVTEPAHC
jgi:hypothetical protein